MSNVVRLFPTVTVGRRVDLVLGHLAELARDERLTPSERVEVQLLLLRLSEALLNLRVRHDQCSNQ